MPAESVKLNVWTEGLGEIWGLAPDYQERREREPMTVVEIHGIISKLLDENGSETNGLFLLEHGRKRVELKINDGRLEVSDPSNANFQNVVIQLDDLKATLIDYFGLHTQQTAVRSANIILIEWLIALVVGAGMIGSFIFVAEFLEKRDGFIQEPEHMEIANQSDFRHHLSRLSGIFVTNLRAGETVIEVAEDGRWWFYDLERVSSRNFKSVRVEEGLCRPVYHDNRLALLTDVNYLFHVENQDTLLFQDRRYLRMGKSRDDLPFVEFPE